MLIIIIITTNNRKQFRILHLVVTEQREHACACVSSKTTHAGAGAFYRA